MPIKAGERLTLAEVRGSSGTVRRIWAVITDRGPAMLRGLKIEAFWDGATTPAVSVPFGDFFGTGLGRMARFESALFSSPEGRSYNCMVPMPFRSGMKIVLTNESGKDLESIYYDVDYTLGDKHGPNMLYFHAHWRRENPTQLQRDFELLPHVKGRGRYLGANIGMIANRERYGQTWWGEGEIKVYLDGDTALPTLSGTGTEDYIGTSYGQSRFTNLYQGCQIADAENMQYCFYRYHVPDPVWFSREARVTIQQIGYAGKAAFPTLPKPVYRAGKGLVEADKSGLNERQDDWSSCTYFYLDRPENGLPPLAAPEARMKGLAAYPPVL
ncbi:MAG TPA: glycoside hydrolase family 172 protein [Bryobacteraceae bacterium]|nr:glycoside hydrolase family 172 protein [Bryobacteraceae bacterium]